MELYEDADALEAHGKSDHFKAAGSGFVGLMEGPPEIQRLEINSKKRNLMAELRNKFKRN